MPKTGIDSPTIASIDRDGRVKQVLKRESPHRSCLTLLGGAGFLPSLPGVLPPGRLARGTCRITRKSRADCRL